MYFEPLRKMAKAATDLKIKELLRLLFSDIGIQDFVVELNTQNQLFDKGIDGQNRRLSDIGGSYSPATVEIKASKGQPVNRVTLKDTGNFYETFEVIVSGDGIEIVADTIKGGVDLQIRWSDEILGLNDESIKILIERIIPVLQDEIKERLLHS